ncbi:hypothetical protein GCM10022393_03880 [Aquimarina addita]|uniref:Uncharacterized protein n=1 Tax=Aquimarina addita TaxID=870485 RepID=A0ABP7X9A7_9FLAO
MLDYEVFVSFSKYKSKWYLKRIKATNTYKNSGDLFDEYIANTESELIINDVKTNNISKYIQPEIFQSTFSNTLFNYPKEYTPEFWKHYNTLVPTGVVGKALEDLESRHSLQEQFEEQK